MDSSEPITGAQRVLTEQRGVEDLAEQVLRVVGNAWRSLSSTTARSSRRPGRSSSGRDHIGEQVHATQVGVEHVRVEAGVLLGGERAFSFAADGVDLLAIWVAVRRGVP